MKSVAIQDSQSYLAELAGWRQARDAELRNPDGWLTLAGLFWLEEGVNEVGSEPGMQIRFPAPAPQRLGQLILNAGQATFLATPGTLVTHDDQPVESLLLRHDMQIDGPTVLAWGSLRWYVIKRGDRFGVRLRDWDHPALVDFAGVARFPADPAWRIPAILEPANPPRTIPVPTILGTVNQSLSPGVLRFEIDGVPCQLDALQGKGGTLSLIFADATTGHGTYGGGRFLTVAAPDSAGNTMIDFNKAYNPPCLFTPFATCPRPPAGNRLPVAVRAGEKVTE